MSENKEHLLQNHRYKDGMELRSGGKYRIVEDDDKVQLIVRGVEKDDAGDITCELSNSKGKEAATAKLRVQSTHPCLLRLCQIERRLMHFISRVFQPSDHLFAKYFCSNMCTECTLFNVYIMWLIFQFFTFSVLFINYCELQLALIDATFHVYYLLLVCLLTYLLKVSV